MAHAVPIKEMTRSVVKMNFRLFGLFIILLPKQQHVKDPRKVDLYVARVRLPAGYWMRRVERDRERDAVQ